MNKYAQFSKAPKQPGGRYSVVHGCKNKRCYPSEAFADRAVDGIVYSSVGDGLISARHASDAVVERAIKVEAQRDKPRSALITGLQRELRRRDKQKGKS
jgi:hypothetical protein